MALPATYANPATPKLDAHILARLIDREAGDEDVILFYLAERDYGGVMPMYYFTLGHYAHHMAPSVILAAGAELDATMMARLRGAAGIWTVAAQGTIIRPRFCPVSPRPVRAKLFWQGNRILL